MMTFRWSTLIAIGAVCCVIGVAPAIAEDNGPIVDAQLAKAIRHALGNPTGPLTPELLSGLTELDASAMGLLTLDGLEMCTHLRTLNLAGNFAEPMPWCITGWTPDPAKIDLSPLSALTALESLDLSGNTLFSVPAIAPLTRLQVLHLDGNNLTDLAPLAGMKQLRELTLGYGEITDHTEVFSSLGSLETVTVGGAGPRLFQVLASCPRLTTLELHGFEYNDENEGSSDTLEGIGALRGLQSLTVSPDELDSLAGIEGCTDLRFLDIKYSPVEDLTPLAGLTRLESLDLTDTLVSDLGPLRNCTALTHLDCGERHYHHPDSEPYPDLNSGILPAIEDLAPLRPLTALQWLRLDTLAPTCSLAPLGALVQLKELHTQVIHNDDIATIAALPELESLTLAYHGPFDLSPLSGLPRLHDLNLTTGSSARFDQLGGCTRLQALTIRTDGNYLDVSLPELKPQIGRATWDGVGGNWDVSSLSGCPDLRRLEIMSDGTAQWHGIGALTQLEALQLYGCDGPASTLDLSALTRLTSLKLWLPHQTFDCGQLSGLANLQELALAATGVFKIDALLPLSALTDLKLNESRLDPGSYESALPLLRVRGVLKDEPNSTPYGVALPAEPEPIENPLAEWILFPWDVELATDGWPLSESDAPVTFTDPNLERRLRLDLDIPDGPLTERDLSRVRVLSLSMPTPAITSLEGLEHCVNLRQLELNYNVGIADYTPLTKLPHLEILNLYEAKVPDLGWIAGCQSLTALNLDGLNSEYDSTAPAWLPDLAPLQQLPHLTTLSLCLAGLTDVSPLAGCTSLERLDLSANPIADLAPLAACQHLRQLDLSEILAQDFSVLSQLPALEYIGLSRVGDEETGFSLAPLAHCPKLRVLMAYNTPITDLEPLRNLLALEEVVNPGGRFNDLSPLTNHPHLRKLQIGENDQLTTCATLTGVPVLEEFWAPRCGIASLAGVDQWPALTTLACDDGLITDYAPLAGITTLEWLALSGNPGTDLAPLAGLMNLKSLEIHQLGDPTDGQVCTNLAPLAGLSHLEYLDASRNGITDLSPLRPCTALQALIVSGCPITDLSVLLEGYPRLYECAVSGTTLSAEAWQVQLPVLRQRMRIQVDGRPAE